MQVIYDSDDYVVMHLVPAAYDLPPVDLKQVALTAKPLLDPIAPLGHKLLKHGFEIVDKNSGREVYLHGSWAELFQEQVSTWRRGNPTPEQVEATLKKYTALASHSINVH